MSDTILTDERPIAYIDIGSDESIIVGQFGITKIEAYGENGMHCDLPWFRVYKGDVLIQRVNAKSVSTVRYKD